MDFGFAWDSPYIDLLHIDLLDIHLDLLDTYILRKHFVYLQDVLKTSSRHVLKMSSRHVFQTSSSMSSRHVFQTSSRHVLKTSWRRLQRDSFSSSKTCSRRVPDVSKTSWRRLDEFLEDEKLLRWRRVEHVLTCWRRQDVLNTNKCWQWEADS